LHRSRCSTATLPHSPAEACYWFVTGSQSDAPAHRYADYRYPTFMIATTLHQNTGVSSHLIVALGCDSYRSRCGHRASLPSQSQQGANSCWARSLSGFGALRRPEAGRLRSPGLQVELACASSEDAAVVLCKVVLTLILVRSSHALSPPLDRTSISIWIESTELIVRFDGSREPKPE